MATKIIRCEIEGCEDEAVTIGLCHNCYQYLARWKGRTLKKIMKRQKRIRLWENRLEVVGGARGANR